MKVALYLRVSTTDQDPESQGREVRQFVADRGWETVETYQDVGVSGARARRPALDQLVATLRTLRDDLPVGDRLTEVFTTARNWRATTTICPKENGTNAGHYGGE